MKIKKGDTVVVITGKDKGKKGTVLRALPRRSLVVVEGVNLKKKHVKPQGRKHGGIVDIQHPIHVSNVMLVDPKTGAPTRVGKKFDEKKGVWVRVAKKSGSVLS